MMTSFSGAVNLYAVETEHTHLREPQTGNRT